MSLVIEIQNSGNHCSRLNLVNYQCTVFQIGCVASLLCLMLNVSPSVVFTAVCLWCVSIKSDSPSDHRLELAFYPPPAEMVMPHLVLHVPSLFHILRSGDKHLETLSLSIRVAFSCFISPAVGYFNYLYVLFVPRGCSSKECNSNKQNNIWFLEHPHLPAGPSS